MAQTALVDWDISSGARMLEALTEAHIPVDHAFWSADLDEGEQWVFHVITPLYDTKGPRETVELVDTALAKAGVASQFRDRLQVSGPQGLSTKVQRQLDMAPLTSMPAVSGAFVQSVVPYVGGTVVIVLEDPAANRFRVTFSPYRGPGSAMRPAHLHGTLNLTEFLLNKLGIDEFIAREAVVRAAMTGRWSIPNVSLSTDTLQLNGLAAA